MNVDRRSFRFLSFRVLVLVYFVFVSVLLDFRFSFGPRELMLPLAGVAVSSFAFAKQLLVRLVYDD